MSGTVSSTDVLFSCDPTQKLPIYWLISETKGRDLTNALLKLRKELDHDFIYSNGDNLLVTKNETFEGIYYTLKKNCGENITLSNYTQKQSSPVKRFVKNQSLLKRFLTPLHRKLGKPPEPIVVTPVLQRLTHG